MSSGKTCNIKGRYNTNNANDRKCAVIIIAMLFVSGLAISVEGIEGTSFNPSDIEWGKGVSNTLYKDGMLTNGEYSIKVVEFSSPVPGIKIIENGKTKIIPANPVEQAVHIGLYKDGVFIKEILLTIYSGIYISEDYEIKISATEFLPSNAKEWIVEYYKPWAKITIQKRGRPGFDVTFNFNPEKRIGINKDNKNRISYFNGDTFIVNVVLKNGKDASGNIVGDAVAKNVDVYLDIGQLILLSDPSKLHYSYNEILKDGSMSFDVMFGVPKMIEEQEFNLSVRQKFYDVKGAEYNKVSSILVSTGPRLIEIGKSMKDRLYLKDRSVVKLTVTNIGNFNIYDIHMEDNLDGNFVRADNGTEGDLRWNIPLLKPGEDWSVLYTVRPTDVNINGFTVLAANATIYIDIGGKRKQYNMSSNINTVVVNGPKIVLTKTVNKNTIKIGESVTVTVAAKNVGNAGTKIEVSDILPDSASLKGGVMYLKNWSEPGSTQAFSYTMFVNKEGQIELPAAISNYTSVEYYDMVRAVTSSDKLIINVVDPKNVTPVPSPTPTENTIVIPGFSVFSGMVAIMLITYRMMRKRDE